MCPILNIPAICSGNQARSRISVCTCSVKRFPDNSLRGPRLRWEGIDSTILDGIIATPEQPSIVSPAQSAGTPTPWSLPKPSGSCPHSTPSQLIETLTLCNTSPHWTIGITVYSSSSFDKNHIFVPKWVHVIFLRKGQRGCCSLISDFI